MTQLEVTWPRSLRIWWAIFWRFALLSLAGGVIVALIALVVLVVTDMTSAQLDRIAQSMWMQCLYNLIGLISSIIATKAALHREWKEFRLALLPRSAQETRAAVA